MDAIGYDGYVFTYRGKKISGKLDHILTEVGKIYGVYLGEDLSKSEKRAKVDAKVNKVLVLYWDIISDVKRNDVLGTGSDAGTRYGVEKDANERMYQRGNIDRSNSWNNGTKGRKPTFNGNVINGY